MDQNPTGQAARSAAQNADFFARETYGDYAADLDSHARIRAALNREVKGLDHVLDVGNGGVFEYDTSLVSSIVAVDLFLDPDDPRYPANVTAKRGDALALDELDDSYDAVLQTFLHHHLVGDRPADSLQNIATSLREARRVLKPGGSLIIAESCVPFWFYNVERVAFRPLQALAATKALGGHPATLQLPLERLSGLVSAELEIERAYPIPLGRWITQFGRRFPTALTPVRAHMIVARKPGK